MEIHRFLLFCCFPFWQVPRWNSPRGNRQDHSRSLSWSSSDGRRNQCLGIAPRRLWHSHCPLTAIYPLERWWFAPRHQNMAGPTKTFGPDIRTQKHPKNMKWWETLGVPSAFSNVTFLLRPVYGPDRIRFWVSQSHRTCHLHPEKHAGEVLASTWSTQEFFSPFVSCVIDAMKEFTGDDTLCALVDGKRVGESRGRFVANIKPDCVIKWMLLWSCYSCTCCQKPSRYIFWKVWSGWLGHCPRKKSSHRPVSARMYR